MTTITNEELVRVRVQNILNMYKDGALFNHEPPPPLTTMRALPLMCWTVLEVRKTNRGLIERNAELEALNNVLTLERDLARCEAGIIGQYVPADKTDEIKEELEPIYAEFATKIPHPFEQGDSESYPEDVCVKCGLSPEEGPHG